MLFLTCGSRFGYYLYLRSGQLVYLKAMTDWIKCISELMGKINAQWDVAKRSTNKQLGTQDPIHIMPYCGYGTPQKIYLKGRVLQDEGMPCGKKMRLFGKIC